MQRTRINYVRISSVGRKKFTTEREAVWVIPEAGPIPRVLKKGHAFALAANG